MHLLTVKQIRAWDKFTIEHQQITSVELMERAAKACVQWLKSHLNPQNYYIFCGTGNNGGDGLAIAALLQEAGKSVEIIIIGDEEKGSPDFTANFHRVQELKLNIQYSIEAAGHLPDDAIIIDAIFGSGLNRPADGESKKAIEVINDSGLQVVAVDIPSGLYAEKSSANIPVIKAKYTLSFQSVKPAFLIAENEEFVGQLHLLNIDLSKEFIESLETRQYLIDAPMISRLFKPRKDFAHKGTFGHALLLAGSLGKMGAAVLAARACVRSGAGLVTAFLPSGGNLIMQISVPEVMCMSDDHAEMLTMIPDDLSKYQVAGVGPGIGKSPETTSMLRKLLTIAKFPLVIDADALNIIGENPELLKDIPAGSILTPHPKEFERLFGKTEDEFARLKLAVEKAIEYNVVIVSKGHHTAIALPDGKMYFNNTGNSGMAKGGAGDTLTGIITSLLAQKYSSENAAILGVYLHGLAGDIAAEKHSREAMLPSDISDCLGDAFKRIQLEHPDY